MACNIILGNARVLRTTQFSFSTVYDIGEVNFYIPVAKANSNQVFLVLKNSRNLREIVELIRSKNETQKGVNALYKLNINSSIRVGDEAVEIYLLLINKETDEYSISSKLKINLSAENYKIARQAKIVEEVSQKVQEYYAKILVLTEINQELYKKIEEELHNESNL